MTGKQINTDGFRMEFSLDKKQSCLLIHYMGDHKTTVEFPHGNCKSNDKQFVRTCPSVINAAKQSVDLPSNVVSHSQTTFNTSSCIFCYLQITKKRFHKSALAMRD